MRVRLEDTYPLTKPVGHVLTEETKSPIQTRGKTTKVKENSIRQRQ